MKVIKEVEVVKEVLVKKPVTDPFLIYINSIVADLSDEQKVMIQLLVKLILK